jgi:SSS family solute:Na+ symporter
MIIPLLLADATPAIHHANSFGLRPLDWAIMAAYMLFVLGQGWYYARGQTSASEFIVGSNRPMAPWIVGLSLYATLLSTITYLAKPGEMINKGPVTSLAQIISLPIVYLLMAHVLLPVIMRRRVTSVYEYLEARVGLAGRLMGAGLFLLLRLVWMALMIYLTSVVLAVVMNLGPEWVPLLSIVVGIVTVAYSTMGGIRAVIMTDMLQASLLFVGAIATILVVTWYCQGLAWVPTEWSPTWDSQPFMSFDPHVRVTVIGSIIHMTLWRVATVCGDQTAIQRYMAVSDLPAARRTIMVTCVATAVSAVLLSLVGFALLGFYQQFTEALPPGMSIERDADHLFPHFIAHYLPPGVSGLVVTAILAAAMSSLDSGVSAVTGVLETDFLTRAKWYPRDGQLRIRILRWLGLLIGVGVIAVSFIVERIPGNVMEVTNKTANLVTVPIFGLFLLAWFLPFVTPLGAMLGTGASVCAAILIGFWDMLTGNTAISFQYIGLGALTISLAVGATVSRFGPAREDGAGTRRWAMIGGLLLVGGTIAIAVFGRGA